MKLFFSQIIFLYCIWSRCLFNLLDLPHIYTLHPIYLFLRQLSHMTWYTLLTMCQSTAEGTAYRNVCSDLKCAKPEVNRSTRVDLISHLKPFLFQSRLEVLKRSTNCDIWNFFWGLTQLLHNSFKKCRRRFYKPEGFGDDLGMIWTWFLLASSCSGPSDGTQVSYLKHLGFLMMLYKEQATKHISSSLCLTSYREVRNFNIYSEAHLATLAL